MPHGSLKGKVRMRMCDNFVGSFRLTDPGINKRQEQYDICKNGTNGVNHATVRTKYFHLHLDLGINNNLNNSSVTKNNIMAKVFERIVYEQLYAYLEEHDILCQNQSGFRANHSTVTALLEATDSWA